MVIKSQVVQPLSHVLLFEAPGSSAYGILQARVLKLVAISFPKEAGDMHTSFLF